MKFHQLIAGDIFIHNDKKHIKINNVMAQDAETRKQVFMKRSDVIITETATVKKEEENKSPYNILLNKALNDFQDACLKQFKSYQDGVSMDMVEAEINNIRHAILSNYKEKE